jgi:menaquinone-dependent protoporphyrinogen oxidase
VEQIQAYTLVSYCSIIIGSPLQMQYWLLQARTFVSHNSNTLKAIPVWAFSTGMPSDKIDSNREENIEKWLRRDLPNLRGHKLFLGLCQKEGLRWFICPEFTFSLHKKKAKFGDKRNWKQVNAWADEVEKEIRASRNRCLIYRSEAQCIH